MNRDHSSRSSAVIVTGAAGGLGSEVARRFVAEGHRVMLTDRSPRLAEVADRLGASAPTGHVMYANADVTDPGSTRGVVAQCMDAWGRLDVLVNLAGGSLSTLSQETDKPLWDVSLQEWQLVVDVNLTGSFNWVQAVIPIMREQADGCILLVASGTGMRPGPSMAPYAAAKAGVVGLVKAAARDLGPFNIRVNAVNPGFIPHANFPSGTIEQHAERYRTDTALGRLSSPEHFATFVVGLVDMTAISGQTFSLDSRAVS